MGLIKNQLLGFTFILFATFSARDTFGQTQTELNLNAIRKYKKADLELNSSYQKILKGYASQPLFIKNFKTAQRLWLQLRDAELAARFPVAGSYGSVEPMCKVMYLEGLTRERIEFLKTWLDGMPDGDVCNGSVKFDE